MTQVHHQLVGYDRASGRVAEEHEIPDRTLDYAKEVASVGPADPDAALCYPLTGYQARDIAGAIGAKIDADSHKFYMEGCSEPIP